MSATTIILTQCSKSRLPIPVFRNLFFGSKKPFLTGFLRILFFSCVFRRNFSQECVFGGVTGIPVFFRFYRNFSQEFLWAGIPVFTQDSGGFRRIPEDSCSRQIICSRQTLPQLALPPASPQCRSALRSALKGSQAVVGVFYSMQYHVSLQLNLNTKKFNIIESPYSSLSLWQSPPSS